MKPMRVRMTDELIKRYGLDKSMKFMDIEEEFIENVDFTVFHSDDYIDILKNCTPDNKELYTDALNRCKSYYLLTLIVNFGEDCPIFDGQYDYC